MTEFEWLLFKTAHPEELEEIKRLISLGQAPRHPEARKSPWVLGMIASSKKHPGFLERWYCVVRTHLRPGGQHEWPGSRLREGGYYD